MMYHNKGTITRKILELLKQQVWFFCFVINWLELKLKSEASMLDRWMHVCVFALSAGLRPHIWGLRAGRDKERKSTDKCDSNNMGWVEQLPADRQADM